MLKKILIGIFGGGIISTIIFYGNFEIPIIQAENIYINKVFSPGEFTTQDIIIPANTDSIRVDFQSTEFVNNSRFIFGIYFWDSNEYRFMGEQDLVWNGAIQDKNEIIDHPYIEISSPFKGQEGKIQLKIKSPTRDIKTDVDILNKISFSLVKQVYAASAHVQSTVCDGCTTLAYTSNVTAGNFLASMWRCGGADVTLALTDTIGNTWATADNINGGVGSDEVAILYALNNGSSAANTVDPGTSDDSCASRRWIILEYSGVATASALDQTNKAHTISNNGSSGNITTTQDAELVLCVVSVDSDNNEVISSPFTTRQNGNKISGGDNIITTIQTLDCDGTSFINNTYIDIIIASFKEPVVAGVTPPSKNAPSIWFDGEVYQPPKNKIVNK